jgi:hypothetical protein
MSKRAWHTLERIASREAATAGQVVEALIELDDLVLKHAEVEARERSAKGTWKTLAK